ncbi:hypothetical protein IQ07DRAFT_61221 [Pyrenochaeta sp. DS3sAY3a]|nr:hypothetical protein IQ07DRAFT_61221 [Pyrenochaeta sp. DS3sAY3a]
MYWLHPVDSPGSAADSATQSCENLASGYDCSWFWKFRCDRMNEAVANRHASFSNPLASHLIYRRTCRITLLHEGWQVSRFAAYAQMSRGQQVRYLPFTFTHKFFFFWGRHGTAGSEYRQYFHTGSATAMSVPFSGCRRVQTCRPSHPVRTPEIAPSRCPQAPAAPLLPFCCRLPFFPCAWRNAGAALTCCSRGNGKPPTRDLDARRVGILVFPDIMAERNSVRSSSLLR